jgi:hypothetical protein
MVLNVIQEKSITDLIISALYYLLHLELKALKLDIVCINITPEI